MTIVALLLAALVSPAHAAIDKGELKDALKKNPEVMLDFLKENKKALFDIVNQAAQEEQARRQKEEEENERREFEEAFKNPKKAAITDKTMIRGPKDAKYTLVEYSDFECPYCKRGAETVEALRKKHGNNLRFIFKNLPLPFHAKAMPAAQYFEAAALQSPEKAWQFHDKLFQNQSQLGEAFFKDTAKALGLDVAKLEKDAKSKEVADKIAADMKEAKELGFSGTPGFLLNGVPVKGAYPVEYFDTIVSKLEAKK